jgi:hypothetical protein
MHNEQVCQVSTLLTLLSGVLAAAAGGGASGASGAGPPSSSSAQQLAPDHCERLFLFCLTWSLGGLLDGKDRALFDAKLRTLTDQAPEPVRRPPGGGIALEAGEGRGQPTRLPVSCTALTLGGRSAGVQGKFALVRPQLQAWSCCSHSCR